LVRNPGTMGIGPDLMEGAKAAVREMIEVVAARWGLTREDAYMLCSLAGDLKILEIVDAGTWNVGSRFRSRCLPPRLSGGRPAFERWLLAGLSSVAQVANHKAASLRTGP
jgi:hypothetical protein